MRIIATIVVLIGLAGIALGVLFIVEAGAGEDEIEDTIAPLMISEVEDRYDQVVINQSMLRAMAVPVIEQGGNPIPETMIYNYLSAQRASLGLAKANIGTVKTVRMSGIVDIILGAGFVLAGIALFSRTTD